MSDFAVSVVVHGASESDRVGYLDGWRGLAIALVLCAHFFPKQELIDSGRLGVDVFFCLSGFLMSNILYVRRVSLSSFYKRRVSRIIPVFLLFVVLMHISAWWRMGSFPWVEFLATASFLRTYVPATPDIWHATIPIGHLWSLNVEEHCYVFLSMLTALTFLKRCEGYVVICAGIVSIGIHLVYVTVPSLAPVSAGLGTEVAASHLLISAGYFLMRQRLAEFVRPWMPVAAFILASICYMQIAPWWSRMLFSPFLLAFAVNHMSEAPIFVRTVLALPVLRMLGIWSYSLYIWQQPFYKFQHFFPKGGAFAAAMAAGIGSFYFFENPVRAWLNKKW